MSLTCRHHFHIRVSKWLCENKQTNKKQKTKQNKIKKNSPFNSSNDLCILQQNVSDIGSDCVTNLGGCVMWCGSASPGFDNRGCAGWGRELRYVPRWNATTYV